MTFLHPRSWSQLHISTSRLSTNDAYTENDAASGVTEAPDAWRRPTGHGCDVTDRPYPEVGAPANPMLWRKVLITSGIAALVWAVFFFAVENNQMTRNMQLLECDVINVNN